MSEPTLTVAASASRSDPHWPVARRDLVALALKLTINNEREDADALHASRFAKAAKELRRRRLASLREGKLSDRFVSKGFVPAVRRTLTDSNPSLLI